MTDRLRAGLHALVQDALPRVDYLALYPAEVSSQASDGTLELVPDDERIPALSKVPLRHPFPGVTAKVSAGARVLLGFEEGDPDKPVALAWEMGSLTSLHLGGSSVDGSDVTDFVALASKVDALFNSLKTMFTSWAPVPLDGGASLKALATTALAAPPWTPLSTAASKVKAK